MNKGTPIKNLRRSRVNELYFGFLGLLSISSIQILQLARLLVTKSKSCRSIFCRIRCEFLKFNTSQPTPSSSTWPSGIYKKYTCFPKISINSCSTRSQFYFNLVTAWQEFVFWLDSQFVTPIIRYHWNTLLPEIVAPFHQKSSEHLTTRNCCSVPSEFFRTSY